VYARGCFGVDVFYDDFAVAFAVLKGVKVALELFLVGSAVASSSARLPRDLKKADKSLYSVSAGSTRRLAASRTPA